VRSKARIVGKIRTIRSKITIFHAFLRQEKILHSRQERARLMRRLPACSNRCCCMRDAP
jgi:hypothetical protein